MKRIIYVFTAIAVLALTSCQNWLDVLPKTEIKKDKIFESVSGFQETLIGTYILLSDESLYGREMTAGFMDVIAHQYSLSETSSYLPAYNHDYFNTTGGDLGVSPDGIINLIWYNSYNAISNLNAIIAEADIRKGSVLNNTEYSIIKGEALALRAYIHLDLLRMFGWGNIENDKSVLDKLSIPYVVNYDKALTKQSTVGDVIDMLNKDLDEAISLLELYDPINNTPRPVDYTVDEDAAFYQNRQSRMNYYAAYALKGRVAMWAADYQNAIEYFNESLSYQISFKWTDATEFDNASSLERDLRMSGEYMFRLDVYAQYEGLSSTSNIDGLRPLFDNFQYKSGNTVYINDEYLYISPSEYSKMYDGSYDIRYLFTYETIGENGDEYKILKFTEDEFSSFVGMNKMPLIKMSEVALSLAECYNKTGNSGSAISSINSVLRARGATEYDATLTTADITEAITKEYRRDFIAEGQMFYYYKRLNMDIPDQLQSKEHIFTLPLPAREIEIGFRDDNVSDRE